MVVIVALLSDLLLDKIRVDRSRFGGARRGYMNVLSRGHGHGKASSRRRIWSASSHVFPHSSTGDIGRRDKLQGRRWLAGPCAESFCLGA